jgi:hypothetical protein
MAIDIDVDVDVTEATGLGEPLRTRVTVVLPDAGARSDPPVVCFGFPGGGYSRRYFTFDMPGASGGGQAGWHARRGWVFVACDHLFVGESDGPADPSALTFEHLAAANHATVDTVLAQLRGGTLTDSLPPLTQPVALGIGQSMGGCLTIVQQGQHSTYDGIGVLGYSGRHTVLWMPPGSPDAGTAYVPRGTRVPVLTDTEVRALTPAFASASTDLPPTTPGFHFDDEPVDVVIADMIGYPSRTGPLPAWASATMPPCAASMLSPGVVAPEAATVSVPVFVGVGERNVCPDPWSEPTAYPRSRDVSVFVCPRMSHMHNFAGTRERFWARIQSWGSGVAEQRTFAAPS